MQTPYVKLRWLPDAQRYLKPGVSFEQLAARMSDNEAEQRMQEARGRLFAQIARQQRTHG
ncbi:MAG: hypothetical protein F4082_02165 [Gammaproteobacteria bacterium]|nr:hypothetical protein [Gammaproteobacteria bacterium]